MSKKIKQSVASHPDILPANRPLRLCMLALFSLSVMAGIGVLLLVMHSLQRQIAFSNHDPLAAADNIVVLVRWVAVGFGLGLLGFALWFGWLGTQTVRSGQFPPPKSPVIRDTRIRRGLLAKCIGGAALIFAGTLLVIGTYGAWRFENAVTTIVRRELTPLTPHSIVPIQTGDIAADSSR